MTAQTLFEQGRIADAVASLNERLRAKPLDTHARVFLFELLCFDGDLPRAERQLDVLASQTPDPGMQMAVSAYRDLLGAERTRQRVFTGDALPQFFSPPPAYIEQYVMLVGQLAQKVGNPVETLRAAETATAGLTGRRGGTPFRAFRDADDRVAAVLEVFQDGAYLWLPYTEIRRLQIAAPTRLRELLWTRATVETHDGGSRDVVVPTLYPSTAGHEDAAVRLGHTTVWDALHEAIVVGRGQRMLLVDDAEVPLLEAGIVEFEPASEASA
jgi:type VI secretion system protein ImpE